MPKQTRRKHRLVSPLSNEKKPIEILAASPAFTAGENIYRLTKERHRDGRVREVLRGRDMSRISAFLRSSTKYRNFVTGMAH